VTDNGSSFLARDFERHIDCDYVHVPIQYRTSAQQGWAKVARKKLEQLHDRKYGCR
jgi:hypothetical protein